LREGIVSRALHANIETDPERNGSRKAKPARLREAHEAGTFFFGLTALIVAGTKS
jgi:hypothetical protein